MVVAFSQEPRAIAVDAIHKFQPSSRPLNKTSAPLPCMESTQQNVINVYCAVESLSLDAEMQKCHQMKCKRKCTATLKEECVQNKCSVRRMTHADNNRWRYVHSLC